MGRLFNKVPFVPKAILSAHSDHWIDNTADFDSSDASDRQDSLRFLCKALAITGVE